MSLFSLYLLTKQPDFKFWLRGFIFALCFSVFLPYVKAKEASRYFNYLPTSFIAFPNGLINTTFYYDIGTIDPSRFLLRPRSSVGNIVFAMESKDLSSNSLWTEMPELAPTIALKLSGDFVSTLVWFEILDTKDGKIYETNSHEIWNGKLWLDYIGKINEALLNPVPNLK